MSARTNGCCCSATFTPVEAEGCRVTGATGAGAGAGEGAGTGVEVQGAAEGVARFVLHFRLISISAARVAPRCCVRHCCGTRRRLLRLPECTGCTGVCGKQAASEERGTGEGGWLVRCLDDCLYFSWHSMSLKFISICPQLCAVKFTTLPPSPAHHDITTQRYRV